MRLFTSSEPKTGLIISMFLLSMLTCVGQTQDFESSSALKEFTVEGNVTLVDAPGGRAGKVLCLGPKSKAVWKLRDTDGSGKVSFWIYDDGTVTENTSTSQQGPCWGTIQSDGRVLTPGVFYARYLKGAETYSISDRGTSGWFKSIQYLGLQREPRWHQWTIEFDPAKGGILSLDGKPVKRFDWNKTEAAGFAGVVFFGDNTDGAKNQTLWVDDVNVTLGGLMNIKPVPPPPPPPPPPVLPEKDPAVSAAEVPKLKTDAHPRLIVTAETLPALRKFYASEEAKPFRDNFLSYLASSYDIPAKPGFLKDATDGQRQGLWRLPTVALHYLLTGEKKSFDATVAHMKWLMSIPHWEDAPEVSSGMSAANVMIGAALAFDWTYNELDPAFREEFRKKLWYQARYQYHGGHLMKNPGIHYWQNDPQANHRWHRDAGLALCVLASYNGQEEQGWLLAETLKELQFITEWLPEDGTSHESASYLVFGAVHLTLALQASDDCLGTQFLKSDFFRNAPRFLISSLAPVPDKTLPYGDTGGGLGDYKAFMWKAISVHRSADDQAELLKLFAADAKSFFPGWLSMVWFDPSVPKGEAGKLPLATLWNDVGVAYIRTGWSTNAAAAMFKCGPLGGYKLNEFRNAKDYAYINVAHDDPDANSFVLFNHGELLAETDRYSHAKRSSNYNTILVNGMGQMVPGRMEPQVYAQPGGKDMTQMAKVTAWRDTGDVVAIEGEAAGSYLAVADKKTGKSRPALERFRRTFIWIKGGYVLVLDDIRSTQPADLTWLMQGGDVKALNEAEGRYKLIKGAAGCEFQVVADVPFSAAVADSTADNRKQPLGWKQLQAKTSDIRAARFVSVYDLWNRGSLSVSLAADGENKWTVSVKGKGVNDVWTWQAASGQFEASTVTGTHADAKEPFFVLNKENAAPPVP